MTRALLLASASPRRRELVARLGVRVEVAPAEVDERALDGEAPERYVERVAAAKADATLARAAGWVLAADTAVVVDGRILGKPRDSTDARLMLEGLSGRTHRVLTAYVLAHPDGRRRARRVTTEVTFAALRPQDLDAYLAGGEWRDKAGAYGIQGGAAPFVRELRGSYTGVVGLPLAELAEDLDELGLR